MGNPSVAIEVKEKGTSRLVSSRERIADQSCIPPKPVSIQRANHERITPSRIARIARGCGPHIP